MTDITSNEKTVELSIAEKYLPKLEKLRKYHKSEMDRLGYTSGPSGVVEYIVDREYSMLFGGHHDVDDYYTDRKIRVIVKSGNRTSMEDFEWRDFEPQYHVVMDTKYFDMKSYRNFVSPIVIEVDDLEDIECSGFPQHFILGYMKGFPGFPATGGSEKFKIEVDWSDDYGEF